MRKGLTILELLIVVAIIALLTSLIIVGISNSRLKARDSRIRSHVSDLRNTAEMSFINIGNYEDVCNEDGTISDSDNFGRIKGFIKEQKGIVACNDNNSAFAVIVALNLGDCWCIDSSGNNKKVSLTEDTCADELASLFACP